MRDKEEPSERHIQPYLDSNPQQAPLKSLRNLLSGARVLVIVLKIEALLIGSHQVMFERCFENTNGIEMVTRLSDNIGHCLYLQGPLTHLGGE